MKCTCMQVLGRPEGIGFPGAGVRMLWVMETKRRSSAKQDTCRTTSPAQVILKTLGQAACF